MTSGPVSLDRPVRFDAIAGRPPRIVDDAQAAALQFAAGRRLLNIGCCGSDALVNPRPVHKALTDAAPKCVGIDIYEAGVERLRALGLDARVADAQDFDLPEKDFEAIIVGDVIEHVGNPGALFDCAYRHLADGGRIFVATPNVFAVSNFTSIILKNRYLVNSEHVVWFDPGLLKAIMERSGFVIEELLWMGYDQVLLKRLLQRFRPSLMGTFALIARKPHSEAR